MKTLQLSEEDYETLMELSKELQTQPNHSQAFPYFWEPASEQLIPNDDGDVIRVFDHDSADEMSLEEFGEHRREIREMFLKDELYDHECEYDWADFIKSNCKSVTLFSYEWKIKTDHNPSLFLSDVKGFIESNRHNLGRNPGTYARTVHRMPKMQRLIEILYRINPQPEESVNHEPEIGLCVRCQKPEFACGNPAHGIHKKVCPYFVTQEPFS